MLYVALKISGALHKYVVYVIQNHSHTFAYRSNYINFKSHKPRINKVLIISQSFILTNQNRDGVFKQMQYKSIRSGTILAKRKTWKWYDNICSS
jgi:hypothetical protein